MLSGDTTSFVAQSLNFTVYVAPGDPSFNIGVFDGGADLPWDVGTAPQLTFSLYEDPEGDNIGNTFIQSWTTTNASFANGGWTDLHASGFTTSSTATQTGCSGSGCPYLYLLTVTAADTAVGQNTFKIRTTGTLGMTDQAFGFLTPPQGSWPSGLSQLNANYDGSWDFAFQTANVGTATSLTFWDGDFDHGDMQCASVDTDDPNTVGLPPFTSPGAVAEGVAIGTSTGGVATCSPSGAGVGNPPDDANGANLRRSPSYGKNVVYKVTSPIGKEFVNLNPSGNLEWEKFTVVTSGSDFDKTAASLPNGMYRMKMEGMDAGNQNFWYVGYELIGVTGPNPAPPGAFYTIDKYVFFDTNGDGVKQTTENGIAGAVVTLLQQSSVVSITVSGSVATVTTTAPHGYLPGTAVTISGADQSAFNGTFTIVDVDDPTTFTFAVSGAPASASGTISAAGVYHMTATDASGEFRFRVAAGKYSVRVDQLPAISISALTSVATGSGAIVTATTPTAHGYAAGAKVTISGASPSGFNGTYTILSAPSATTFTYAVTTLIGTTAAAGAITVKNVLDGHFNTTPV
ncbi:MAG TPA: hypothetical protein VEA16_14875, partial [Vicinamibacterales bacterium]|nr:hypothetical protein [Vicinamibacterales bacterium]